MRMPTRLRLAGQSRPQPRAPLEAQAFANGEVFAAPRVDLRRGSQNAAVVVIGQTGAKNCGGGRLARGDLRTTE